MGGKKVFEGLEPANDFFLFKNDSKGLFAMFAIFCQMLLLVHVCSCNVWLQFKS